MRNCPVCGAENEADARFCAECGAPLGEEDSEATMVGRVKVFPGPEDDENERTILSNFFKSTEEAETMTVDQAEIMAARAETPPKDPTPPPAGPEADIPLVSAPPPFERPVVEVPPPVSYSSGASDLPPAGTGGRKNNWPMIIGIVLALLLLCCCCCSLLVGGSIASDPATMDDLMRELGVFVPHFFAWI